MSDKSWSLTEMTLMNWGTYDGLHRIELAPTKAAGRGATCIEGVNGSGKTTLTDAYIMLIRPDATNFNAASNSSGRGTDKRSTLSYMRGEIGDNPQTGEPWLIREADIIISAIKGKFEADGEMLDAAIIMCVNCVTDTREKRVYATSKSEIDLSKLVAADPQNFDPQHLKEILGKDVATTTHYSDYMATLSSVFGVSANWTDFRKLTRLLSMVQGEEAPNKGRVNELFKTYVLPASDAKEHLDKAIRTIDENLESIRGITKKRATLDALSSMGDSVNEIERVLAQAKPLWNAIGRVRAIDEDTGLPVFLEPEKLDGTPLAMFAAELAMRDTAEREQKSLEQLSVLTQHLDELQDRYQQLDREADQIKLAIATATDERRRRLQDSLTMTEQRLVAAREAVAHAENELALREDAHRRAKSAEASAAKVVASEEQKTKRLTTQIQGYIDEGRKYGLSQWPKTRDAWSNMLATISDIDLDRYESLKSEYEEKTLEHASLKSDLEEAERTLEALKGSKSKLPAAYRQLAQARDQIANLLDVEPEQIPFFAELVDMESGEERWRLAANCALGAITKVMLIDSDLASEFRRKSKQVENNLGVRLRYDIVDTEAADDWLGAAFDKSTIAGKIKVDDSSIYAGVAREMLSKRNFICVTDATQFQDDGKRYVTEGGQTYEPGHRGAIGYNKRDRDLIGFVDQYSIEDAESMVFDLQNDMRSILLERTRCDNAIKDIDRRRDFAERLHTIDFDDMDLTAQQTSEDEAKAALDEQRADVITCEQAMHEADEALDHANDARDDAEAAVAAAKADLDASMEDVTDADIELQTRLAEVIAKRDNTADEQGKAKSDIDVEKSALDAIRAAKDAFALTDTSSLTQSERDVCAQYLTASETETAPSNLLATYRRARTNAQTAMRVAAIALENEIEARSNDFKSAEATLGEERYAQLTGIAYANATDAIGQAMPDMDPRDPWQVARARWHGYYAATYTELSEDWKDIDVLAVKRLATMKCVEAIEFLIARAKTCEQDIARRMADVHAILETVRLGSDDHTLEVAYDFRKNATAKMRHDQLRELAERTDATHRATTDEAELDEIAEACGEMLETMTNNANEIIAAIDPNSYINIAFVEHRDGRAHKHANLGKLSGGELQQISACIIGAALLYAMHTEPGDRPCYATIVIDEAFVKADEQHSVSTLQTLIDMGFVPIVSMPPEGVMKLSPCISRLLAVTKHDMRSQIDEIMLEDVLTTA